MKEIKLTGIIEITPGNHMKRKVDRYKIMIDRETTFTFTSKDKADQFLTKLKRFYMFKVIELNKMYVEAFSIYRKVWFIFSSNKKKSIDFRHDERRAAQIVFEDIPFQLDFFMNKEKEVHWVNQKISIVINLLDELLMICRKVYQARKYQTDIHQIDVHLEALNRIRHSFENFENDKADKTPQETAFFRLEIA